MLRSFWATRYTVSLFETFMISTMNTKSVTNGILPASHKVWHNSYLQKQDLIWIKKQQKQQLFRFDVPNTYIFWTK